MPNNIIAQINDHAYKAIQRGGLQKMLDKRALLNESLYEKLDNEVEDIVNKMNLPKIRDENKAIIEEVGDCCLSCLNAVEALEQGDAMCIGLIIERPEAAVADPSRLKIMDIVATYATCDSYLDAARFKLAENDQESGVQNEVHGGFKQGDADHDLPKGQILKGLGNENINGILPLFLFKEHWSIAKRKIAPVFGFMCTLDVLGFSTE